MKVATSYNNFSRGKIDHDMMGRYDLPIYNTGSDVFENMYSNFKGNAIYRTGFEMIYPFQDCVFYEFRFSNSQNYLMCFYENKIRFLSYDSNGDLGWVLSSGVPLEVETNYTLQECREIEIAQNADVLVIVHPNHAPMDLVRTDANAFTLRLHNFAGSSAPVSVTGQVTAATRSNPLTVDVAPNAGFNIGDTVNFTGVGGMTQLNSGSYKITSIQRVSIPNIGPIIIRDRITFAATNSTAFGTYTSGGSMVRTAADPAIYGSPFAAKTVTFTAVTKAYPAVVTSNNHGFQSGDIIYVTGAAGMTELNDKYFTVQRLTDNTFQLRSTDSTLWGTYTASTAKGTREDRNPSSVAFYKGRLYFGKQTTIWASFVGNYSDFIIPTTVTDTSPLQFTIADLTQEIDWLFGGDNSLLAGASEAIVAINGGGVGSPIKADSVEANITSADGTNGAYPLRKDGLVFYVGRNNRNVYYFSYDLLTESFNAEDANFISYDITKGGMNKIRYKKDRNDLIYCVRNDGKLLSLNFKQKENIVGWHSHATNGDVKDIAVITDNDGNPELFALVLRNGTYYIEKLAKHPEFEQRVTFFTGEEAEDQEAYTRAVAEQLKGCNYLDNSLSLENLQVGNTITYMPIGNTLTATANVFVVGDVGKHISYKTYTGYESGRFEIKEFIDAKNVVVEVLQEPTTNTYDNWYLSFRTISGLSQFIGQQVGIVTDGGYLSEFNISSDSLDLGTQVLSCVVGYRYLGVIKSFSLGFQAGASNTQMTMKAVTRVGLRCVASAGGKFGTTPYRLEPVQQLGKGDLNYLPPIPMDGTKYISYVDNNDLDKFYYFIQDEPLPFTITSIMIEANYSGS